VRSADEYFHSVVDPHRHQSSLSDIILGGQDGVVNVLGVILGVAAASADPRIVLAAGVAAGLAESVSMAAVAYTSRRADQARYESELARERRHIERVPALESDEIRDSFRSKGFSGELLDQIVSTITSNKEVWVAIMMAEELKLAPIDRQATWRASAVVGGAALVGSALPLLPFLWLAVPTAMVTAVVLAAVTLFAVGAYKSATTVGYWLWGGLEMSGIGLAAAAIGWAVGLVFHP
jgi:VIT1/CCC1 family predicted Fe2+/Mn2+ transporter